MPLSSRPVPDVSIVLAVQYSNPCIETNQLKVPSSPFRIRTSPISWVRRPKLLVLGLVCEGCSSSWWGMRGGGRLCLVLVLAGSHWEDSDCVKCLFTSSQHSEYPLGSDVFSAPLVSWRRRICQCLWTCRLEGSRTGSGLKAEDRAQWRN